ncbi:MAG: DUF368 domain-containing protein [Burkholderiales bacterium]|nr:MAG: DUF368 domain-containing protein [Burkholderiales bacterium]
MRSVLSTLARGFCMGAADVVPGVSGGTMAFILGIYQRLLEAIRAFDLQLLAVLRRGRLREAARHVDLVFLLPLACGIFGALMFFTRVVPLPTLIRTHGELVYGLFFGLVLGSIVSLWDSIERVGPGGWLALAAGALFGFGVVNLVPTETPEAAWFLFLSGALAITAMILPGVSGSFVLLILNKYAYLFEAIGRFDFAVLVPFGFGAAAGLAAFSRLLVWLLHRFRRATLLAITGVLVGTLWMIWPFQARTYATVAGKERLLAVRPVWPPEWDATAWASLGLMAAGLFAVIAIHWMARSRPAPG